jgi:exo-beta-1,3-glucanase (GH17 family)
MCHAERMKNFSYLLIVLITFSFACCGFNNYITFKKLNFESTDTACKQPNPAPGKYSLAGLAYGPMHNAGAVPIVPSSQDIKNDMLILSSITHYIRTYNSTGPADAIIQAAETEHVCVDSGIGLGRDPAINASEMTAGEQLATNSAAVHAVIVGSEVLLRGDLSESQLLADIQQVHDKLANKVPITTGEIPDQWLQHPDLASKVDFITVHIYPFWQGVSIDGAIPALDKAYERLKAAFPGKQIVIGETGWPSAGSPHGAAVPSPANQARYLRDFINWAQAKQVQYFYFEAFDEGWKVNEGDVGTHWGLYQSDSTSKM